MGGTRHHKLREASLKTPGETPEKLRLRIAHYGRDVAKGRTIMARLDAPVERLVDLIARESHLVGDKEVEDVRAAGYTDAAIFEIAVVAAVACGLQRLEDAMELVQESER